VASTNSPANSTVNKCASSWGGSTMGLTFNGNTVDAGVFDGNMNCNTIGIGRCSGGGDELFGCIANVRIYATQLSASQLAAITT
jgi:hypothetical protein